jgi:hypothetical protein
MAVNFRNIFFWIKNDTVWLVRNYWRLPETYFFQPALFSCDPLSLVLLEALLYCCSWIVSFTFILVIRVLWQDFRTIVGRTVQCRLVHWTWSLNSLMGLDRNWLTLIHLTWQFRSTSITWTYNSSARCWHALIDEKLLKGFQSQCQAGQDNLQASWIWP